MPRQQANGIEAVVQEWARSVDRELPRFTGRHASLRESGALVAELCSGAHDSERENRLRGLAQQHGRGCSAIAEHTVEEVVAEFRLLRRAFAPVAKVDHEQLDVCMEAAVEAFATARSTERNELADAIRLRDDLLSMVSHELRTPLSALLLQLQLLERTAGKHDEALSFEAMARLLPKAIQLATRLNAMLDRLLDLSRIRTDRFGLELTTVDLCSVLHELVARLRPRADQAGCPLETRACAELFANVDPLRIEQVLTNLISNAIKYGDGKPIEISLEPRDHWAVIEVRDQGAGIPERDHQRIFERYVRAHHTHRSESLGLGLYITREIVLAHGGTIEVESDEGQGSTFRVTIPTHRMI